MMTEQEKNQEFKRGYLSACCDLMHERADAVKICAVLSSMEISQSEVDAFDLHGCDAKALAEIRATYVNNDPIKAE